MFRSVFLFFTTRLSPLLLLLLLLLTTTSAIPTPEVSGAPLMRPSGRDPLGITGEPHRAAISVVEELLEGLQGLLGSGPRSSWTHEDDDEDDEDGEERRPP